MQCLSRGTSQLCLYFCSVCFSEELSVTELWNSFLVIDRKIGCILKKFAWQVGDMSFESLSEKLSGRHNHISKPSLPASLIEPLNKALCSCLSTQDDRPLLNCLHWQESVTAQDRKAYLRSAQRRTVLPGALADCRCQPLFTPVCAVQAPIMKQPPWWRNSLKVRSQRQKKEPKTVCPNLS